MAEQQQQPSKSPDRTVQIEKIGNALGVVVPEDVVARLGLHEGDRLVIKETERGLELSPRDPRRAKGLEIAREAFREYAETFKALAK